jgi:hypothetical protein
MIIMKYRIILIWQTESHFEIDLKKAGCFNIQFTTELSSTIRKNSPVCYEVFMEQNSGKTWVLKHIQFSVPNRSNI